MKKLLMMIGMAAVAADANASSIAIDSVAQRWPWNNKVDITYTVSGGQNTAAGVYARIVFTATIGGTDYTIDGVHDVGASASDGQHTVTWTVPSGLRANGCTMTATLLSADFPSGDDYMIMDLETGALTYEGLLTTQDASNERYNTADYKTGKLVLRKVPRWADRATLPNAASLPAAGYPTGYENGMGYGISAAANWITDRAYYIGVFPVTQYQYEYVYGSNPSPNKTSATGDPAEQRPVEGVSWYGLRRPEGDSGYFAPTAPVPRVTSATGTFLQRLNYIAGNRFNFDLPTELMWEIAARAGSTTLYYYGDTADEAYMVCGRSRSVATGQRLPNAWGLYDVTGNMYELCLDDFVSEKEKLATRPDPFTPSCSGASKRATRGSSYKAALANLYNAVSSRLGRDPTGTDRCGLRVAMIID